MKTFLFSKPGLIGIVCAWAAFNPLTAQQVEIAPATTSGGSTARLIVNRSADFGLNKSINLFVDGAPKLRPLATKAAIKVNCRRANMFCRSALIQKHTRQANRLASRSTRSQVKPTVSPRFGPIQNARAWSRTESSAKRGSGDKI